MTEIQRCPLSVLVRNEPGVLSRVAGLFARRGFNITSLAVGETDDPKVSRISLVVEADAPTLEQVVKQLQRLVSVIRVRDQSRVSRVERGLVLVKVKVTPHQRGEVVHLVSIFRARVDHVDRDTMILEATGGREKIEAFVDMLRPYGIVEMARTGQIVLARGTTISQPSEAQSGPEEDEDLDLSYDEEDEPETYNISKLE
ncbi:MAG: acetolactate synthase small subunit [Deltaproteobacteria bacterium]|nr:acetolactate synthase small subunit [Deltaproteobacteria bacterium]